MGLLVQAPREKSDLVRKVKAKIERVDLSQAQLDEALVEAKAALPAATFEKLEKVVIAYSTLLKALERKETSLGRLRKMLFGSSSEQSRGIAALQGTVSAQTRTDKGVAKKPPPGHGRNGKDAYPGAKTEKVAHHRLKAGDHCPSCRKGRVYDQRDRPGTLLRLMGQQPITAMIYLLEKLRCNLCGKIFEAKPPEGVGRGKYDETASSMIALLKYGGGFPWNRLEKLQESVGIPLPAATQWEVVRDAARVLEPVYEELQRQAAQGKVIHNDDTTMKILAWMGQRRRESLPELPNGVAGKGRTSLPAMLGDEGVPPGTAGKEDSSKRERTGIFTSGIVSVTAQRPVALFFTGLKHAGENLAALLDKREKGVAAPIQMCDALSRNLPKGFKTILANCLAHGRRQFVDVVENFPQECAYVLRVLGAVYKHDAIAKKRKMTDSDRLRFHQKRSGPLMEKLHAWLKARIDEKEVEPNSGMGGAIEYMLKHWEPLTLFLRKAGAPLDNNAVERILKKAILHRKNSLFYKTDNGARVGDLFMSLIHTCELSGADPFDYLTNLQRHVQEVQKHPERWLPWNYLQNLGRSPPG